MRRRPTIIDVAQVAGVSKATVARVVNGETDLVKESTRQHVLSVIERMGYERNAIAGSLRSNRTYMIALSIPDITNPFWPEVARGVQDTVEAEGYMVVLMNNDWNSSREHNHLQLMRNNQFDGLIVNPTGLSNTDLTPLHIPVVVLASGEAYPNFDTVSSDSQQAGRLALEHLIGLGHHRIGLIIGSVRRPKSSTHYGTYVSTLRQHGLPVEPDLVVETTFTEDGGYGAMQQFLTLAEPPTAVFAVNDIIALGAMLAAQHANLRVPDQLSIIGMDDIHAAATTFPPLTTVAKPKYEIGTTAARFLLERLEAKAPEEPRRVLLPCTLIPRSSTAAHQN
ncbi:MAG: LacI family transcriptional regulator [Anaerolineae bacterium]|nr:LacI family transcriptional regulator [Anaerolineae bacterium]